MQVNEVDLLLSEWVNDGGRDVIAWERSKRREDRSCEKEYGDKIWGEEIQEITILKLYKLTFNLFSIIYYYHKSLVFVDKLSLRSRFIVDVGLTITTSKI